MIYGENRRKSAEKQEKLGVNLKNSLITENPGQK